MLLFLISQKGLFNIIGVMRYVLVLFLGVKKYLKTVCFVRFVESINIKITSRLAATLRQGLSSFRHLFDKP